ncbi:polymorphic toxin-type HINT domain-containing protein [Streptomyces sp. NPDC089919]|uniref:polymorphic toxin-type HINT domain-containing protein n=1 Tax=Streptomyces sp. NPDC089919 TaxID=3155188 RepID=UPI003418550F
MEKVKSVDGHDLVLPHSKSAPAAREVWKPTAVRWPAAASRDVDLAAPAAAGRTARLAEAFTSAAGTPVKVAAAPGAKGGATSAPAKVRVSVADRTATAKAGVKGVLLSVQRTDGSAAPGKARVELDYKAFRDAYGGGWSSRLRLVSLPACALTTPNKPECLQRTPLDTRNNGKAGTLTATVPLPMSGPTTGKAGSSPFVAQSAGIALLSAEAGSSGDDGSFKATSLSPSGSWSAGGNSGGFGWNIPIGVPSAPGGLAPKINLSYSSSSIDGRTASTNNQSSWIGEGWDYSPGYVERTYAACENDKQGGANNTEKVGDLCWKSENATLSLNGSSNELVWDAGKKVWKLSGDDGSRVERLYDATDNGSGDDDFEYWKVTTTDGTQYFFGKNRLPGWTDGKRETKSVNTVPVFGNHTGEPGHASDFASSAEQQGWRWNLDYVVDPHGNAMAYYYTKYIGYYAKNNKTDSPSAYTRDGVLTQIDYGLRAGKVYDTANPAGRVTFGLSDRCEAETCTLDEAHKDDWAPDVPVDLLCTSGTKCWQSAPTYWSTKRLKSINTYALVGTTLTTVDSWNLAQSWPTTGDTGRRALWFESIQRTGKSGGLGDLTLPATTFDGTLMPNRVDAADGKPPLNKRRITKITNETGGQTLVTYSPTECTTSTLPAADKNTKRCYPSWWTRDGAVDPEKDWFHKYVVTQVTEDDTTGGTGSPSKTTKYTYATPNWRKDDGEFTLDKHRTYNQWQGYTAVNTYVGTTNQTKTGTTYYTGMGGDDFGVTDRPDFAGRTAQTRTYEGASGPYVTKTTNIPWVSGETATQPVKGITDPDQPSKPAPDLPAKTAHLSGTATTLSDTLLDDGSTWRRNTTTRTYDPTYGLQLTEGDDGVGGTTEAQCTKTSYVTPDTTNWLINYAAKKVTTSHSPCSDTSPNAEVTGAARSYFDGQAYGVAPKPGLANATKAEEAAGLDSGGLLDWQTTAQSTYDQYGRALTSTGEDGEATTTDYTPETGAQPTSIKVTDPKGNTATTTFDGLRGLTLKTTDANGRSTNSAYDSLGRLTKGWAKGRATTADPNVSFTYKMSSTAQSAVTTKSLYEDGTTGTSVTLYDSLLRQRQTQSDSIGVAGRIVSDTFYDDHGRVARTNAPYYNSDAVSTTPFVVTDNQVPSASTTDYDNRGRATISTLLSLNVAKWSTKNTYGTDWSAVLPPDGSPATLSVTDPRGRVVERRQYKDRNPLIGAASSKYEKHTYQYDTAGRLAKVSDNSGRNAWSYTYDLRGRQLTANDPDKGLATTHFGSDGRVDTVKDAEGNTLATTYDELGRKTSLRKGSVTGTKLAQWTYDTVTGGKGLPATSTRYDGTAAYTTSVVGYDVGGRATGAKLTVPTVTGEEELAGTYTVATTATDVNGLPETVKYSTGNSDAAAALPAETVTNNYGAQDQLALVDGNLSQVYLRGAKYTPFGELAQAELGNLGKRVTQSLTYEAATRRVATTSVDREATAPATLSDIRYTYDDSGNVTRIRDLQNDASVEDDQCYDYDWAARLTDAWTTAGTCTTKPTTGAGTDVLGTVDPYWTSWTFTDTGQRATETQHKAGPITADTKRTYAYPTAAGAAQAHGVRSVTATGGTNGTDTYSYDKTGNLETKNPAVGATQTLTWNEEGKLATSTLSGSTTSFLYDAEGTRLLKREPAKTTLYLPGGQELILTKSSNALAGNRYYSVPGGSAIRSSDGYVRFLIADHHGTNTLSVTAANLAVNRRKQLPYGGERGAAPAFWPGQKGFVGGDIDATTGLTHIGAREYDTKLGQFISVDPILTLDQPQSLNGYAYANNSPVTGSDPTGLQQMCGEGGAACYPDDWNEDGTDNRDGDRSTSGNDECGHDPECQTGWHSNPAPTGTNGNGNSGKGKAKAPEPPPCSPSGYPAYCNPKLSSEPQVPTAAEIPDLPCPEGDSAWVCGLRNSMYKAGVMTGMTGGSYGVIGMVGGARGMVGGARGVARGSVQEGGGNCFLAGTLVLMADGTSKAIEDIEVGDKVYASDPESGDSGPREVTQLIRSEGERQLNRLSIETPNGTKSLTATREHPFWSPSEGRWVKAGELRPGMTLRTATGKTVTVTGNSRYTDRVKTYNFTVRDLHTYYVMAGSASILVHNKCDDPVNIYRTPKTIDREFELKQGPNPAMQDAASNGKIYFGERSVAAEYQGRGPYAPGMIRYEMHPSFLSTFGETAKRYDWQGPGGAPRIEFEIPFDRLDEFNSLTINREWLQK